MEKRGLVLFVGGTGSGKSTSLAALIDYRNRNSGGHIITIEDPVEYVHRHKKSIINQREVGVDTRSFHAALKNTLRQAPDVILIGEIRDRETMEHALAFADTGHLAISTLHANNANQALDRIINFFPEERRSQLLMDLSLNLKAVVSQRLMKKVDGKGRVAVNEILVSTPAVSAIIREGATQKLYDVITSGKQYGMQFMDEAIRQKLFDNTVSPLEAYMKAIDKSSFRQYLPKEHEGLGKQSEGGKAGRPG
jgi:twitching motility protein PilU